MAKSKIKNKITGQGMERESLKRKEPMKEKRGSNGIFAKY